MNLSISTGQIIAGIVFSGIGFAVFRFGKKEALLIGLFVFRD